MSDTQEADVPLSTPAGPHTAEVPKADEARVDISELAAPAGEASKGRNVDALLNVRLDVRVVLGHTRMSVAELLKLTRGSVIELDRKVGDPVDIMINDRLVARGDLIKIEGDMIGVALREIVKDFAPGD